MLTLENIQSLYAVSPNAYLVMLPDAPRFTIAEANEAFLKATNTLRSDIIGKSIFEAFPGNPATQDSKGLRAIKVSLEHTMLLKKPHKGILQRYDIKVADGYEMRFWSLDTFPLLDENKSVKFIVQNPIDVTSSVISQHEQQVNVSLQSPLVLNYPDAVFSLDLKGNFLSANKAVLDLAECSKEELLQQSFVPFIAPGDFEEVFNYFQKAINGKIQNFDANVISARGTPRILNVTNLPIVVNQEIIGIHVIAKDITALKKAEKQLVEYNRRIADILESITDGFFAVDRNWIVTYWNKEAERILLMQRADIMGKNLWDVYKDAVSLRFYTEYQRAMTENVSVRFDEYYPPLKIWIEVSVFPSGTGLSVYFKDITERKKSDEQLNQEKEKYRELFDLSPIPKWVYDIKTLRFLDVNESAVNHYGYSRKEFLAMTIMDIRPAEEKAVLEEILKNKVKRGKFNSSSIRHMKKNGETIYINVKSNPITFDKQDARLILAIDVTEKLKAEQKLETSEQRFKALVQDGSDLISILDEDGNYTYVSPTSKFILGIHADFFIGKNAFDFIHEEDKERVGSQFKLLDRKKRVKIAPFRFMDADQQYRWIETVITDMTDDPTVAGIVANSRDVTKNIENELKTKESIERYNTVSKATSDTIYDWDILNNNVIWNQGIKGIFGYKQPDKCKQDWWYERVHPDDAEPVVKSVQLLIKNKRSRFQSEYRFRCADGSYKYVFDRGFLVFNTDGQAIRLIGAMQDVTERVSYTRAIEEQNRRLREISWVQSHLVRAPLARIMGLTNLLCDNKADDEVYTELLPLLKESAEDLDVVYSRHREENRWGLQQLVIFLMNRATYVCKTTISSAIAKLLQP